MNKRHPARPTFFLVEAVFVVDVVSPLVVDVVVVERSGESPRRGKSEMRGGSSGSYFPLSALTNTTTTTAFPCFQIAVLMFWRNPWLIQREKPQYSFLPLSDLRTVFFCSFQSGGGGHVKDTFCGLWSCLQHLHTLYIYLHYVLTLCRHYGNQIRF